MKREDPLGPERVGEVLLHAAGLDSVERLTYLAEVAAAEPALAAEVHRRLIAAEEISSFLERPAADRLGDAALAETLLSRQPEPAAKSLPPEERYELGRDLGEGGMGRVVEAYDRQLGRRVALKMLSERGARVSGTFLREGRAQARVRHDHVLDIYDSGELDDQPFLAMRLVDGGTLAELPSELSLEHKIRLLIQVAEGLHAAHREGLLHRDIKPSNVLVERGPDGELSALVSDFGIAANLEDSGWLASEAAGTPQFVAPECLASPSTSVDRRSDVYSLGVTMYQILAGNLPFSGPLTIDVLRQAASEDPAPPRSINPGLPAEIEAIILRCMARDPDERYASARAVAEELRRFLEGEVVEAYAAGLAYRWTRFALRNRVLVASGLVVLASLLIASVAVAIFALRANAARQQAELRQGLAEELVRFMVVDLQKKLEPVSRLAVLDDVVRAVMAYFAAVPPAQLSEEDLLRRSRMLYQLGELRVRQGDLAGATAPMEESLALSQRLHELAPDDPERLFELGQSWFWVGFVAWEQGDLGAARSSFYEYLAVSRRLVEIDPDNPDWQLELSYAESNLGSVLQAEGKLELALERFEASLEIKTRLARASPASPSSRSDLADSHNTVAVAHFLSGHLDRARQHFEQELAIRQALLDKEPENRRVQSDLATTHAYLGKSFAGTEEPSQAEAHAQEALRLLQELRAHDPEDSLTRLKLAWAHLDLGRLAFTGQRVSTAEEEWQAAGTLLGAGREESGETRSTRQARGALSYHFALASWARGDPRARDEVLFAVEIFDSLAAEQPVDPRVTRWWGWSYLLLASLETSPAAAETALGRAAEILAPPATAGTRAQEPAAVQRPDPERALPQCLEWARHLAQPDERYATLPLDPLFCATLSE